MKEELLHFGWKTKRFDFRDLKTTEGDLITIIHFGTHNDDSGPDFLDALVKIRETIWAGNIEFHLNASDWYNHNHHNDKNYDNVILHVVWKEDKAVLNRSGNRIPCLEMNGRLDPGLMGKFEILMNYDSMIPCEKQIQHVAEEVIVCQINKMAVERMEQKYGDFRVQFQNTNQHWEQWLFEKVSSAFGLRVNTEAFISLARSIPIEMIFKQKENLFTLEALLFGQAGLLSDKFKDVYPRSLLKEYKFLRHKYNLTPIHVTYWKFKRLRPSNFPTIRIAQLASFLHRTGPLFSYILESKVNDITQLFTRIQASKYWDNHYLFDKTSSLRIKYLGKSRCQVILINAISPFLYFFGKEKNSSAIRDKGMKILTQISPEKNQILSAWKTIGITANNSFESQGLIHLRNYYCEQKQCLRCDIGHTLLRSSPQ